MGDVAAELAGNLPQQLRQGAQDIRVDLSLALAQSREQTHCRILNAMRHRATAEQTSMEFRVVDIRLIRCKIAV